ncbi:MAG: carbon-monoxide dehydrogenase catalytic subunit [Candidatus Methanoperedenaceae archaeon]|nr:MAG: carbon-monoxide dehydrogenase catalytic subunit [Candidatus Methanoperedenaceae archaeon]
MPTKNEVIEKTPDAASKNLLKVLSEKGIETVFDRFDAQQPQCTFGIDGSCCRRCNMGPCRVSDKRKGICGTDVDTVVISNLLRWCAAGAAAHGQRGIELLGILRFTAEWKTSFKISGEKRIRELAKKFRIRSRGRNLERIAIDVADVLLKDLTGGSGEMRSPMAFAPKERIDTWRRLGILPKGVSSEVFDALARTTVGTDSDWRNLMRQHLRTGIAYCFGSYFGTMFASDCLFGIPTPAKTEVGTGMLKEDIINILVHGHLPPLAEAIIEALDNEKIKRYVHNTGAKGIMVGGMCCTGLEVLERHSIPSITNMGGQELVIGTGLIDAIVVDTQCVFPSIVQIAGCFHTKIITTCESSRIQGALHIPFDPLHADTIAENILEIGIRNFQNRGEIYPQTSKATAISGFSSEAISEIFGFDNLWEMIRSGRIRGLAALVGCSNPKTIYDYNHVTLAEQLIRNDVLVLTCGCSAHALLKQGLCAQSASEIAGEGLKDICQSYKIPPVLHMGSCIDNARILQLFSALAQKANYPLPRLPFAACAPEWSNEKSIGAGLSFLTMGIPVFLGVKPPTGASLNVVKFLTNEIEEELGAKYTTHPDPALMAESVIAFMDEKRGKL